MKYNPDIHQRRTVRLKDYDYSKTGAYFVTIVTQNRECLFGRIENDEIILNDAGKMIKNVWEELPLYYSGVDIDVFQIMPSHIHGIIVLNVGAAPCGCPNNKENSGQVQGPAPTISLPDVVHRFKTMTTKRYIDSVKQKQLVEFNGRLWQRNYYDHIIRNEKDLNHVREYIINNPVNWNADEENPANQNIKRDLES